MAAGSEGKAGHVAEVDATLWTLPHLSFAVPTSYEVRRAGTIVHVYP